MTALSEPEAVLIGLALREQFIGAVASTICYRDFLGPQSDAKTLPTKLDAEFCFVPRICRALGQLEPTKRHWTLQKDSSHSNWPRTPPEELDIPSCSYFRTTLSFYGHALSPRNNLRRDHESPSSTVNPPLRKSTKFIQIRFLGCRRRPARAAAAADRDARPASFAARRGAPPAFTPVSRSNARAATSALTAWERRARQRQRVKKTAREIREKKTHRQDNRRNIRIRHRITLTL